MEWVRTAVPFPWLGDSTTPLCGEFRKGANATVYSLTTPDLQRLGYCLTLNLSESPRMERPSKLSEILEVDPDPKYRLSAKACQGILNRAARRGKELPSELKAALIAQAGDGMKEPTIWTPTQTQTQLSAYKETESTEQIPQDATEPDGSGGGAYTLNTVDRPAVLSFQERAGKPGGGKGILVQLEHTGALSTLNNQSVFAVDVYNQAIDGDCAGTVTAATGGSNTSGPKVMVAGFSFGQSAKARSIGYEEERAPTIRGGEGGNQKPVVFAVDCRNGTENELCNGTLQAKSGGGMSLNLNNVLRVTE